MQRVKQTSKASIILMLLLLYIVCVAVRFLLAIITRFYPTVSIDEFLYFSLGRSIGTEGTLLFRGQPAYYNYVLYPLVIAPIYGLFPQGTDFYRLIQLWNIMLMSLSVFPIFGICNAIFRDRKKSFCLTALFMLLPCFHLGEYIYSEAILYPMFFTLMYCVYRYLKEPGIKYAALMGILGALLYYTKPGAIVPAVLVLLFFAAKAIKAKSKKQGLNVLTGVICLAVVFFGIKLVTDRVLGYEGTMLSLYDEQATFSGDANLEFFFNAIEKYPYYFVLACGIFPLLVSLWQYNSLGKEDKQYYLLTVASVLVTLIGTAWVINRPERSAILHLRYVEMNIPILFIYSVLPATKNNQTLTEQPSKPIRVLCTLLLAYIAVCTAVWGSTISARVDIPHHFLISLSALFIKNAKGTADILIYCLCGGTLFLLYRKTTPKVFARISLALLTALILINNYQGHVQTIFGVYPEVANETAEIHQFLGDTDYLHVYTVDENDYGLDVNSRRNVVQVTSVDFLDNLQENQGIYVPFVPHSDRGMIASRETPDVDIMVIDGKSYPCILFSKNVASRMSTGNNFTLIHFSKGQRIADAVMRYGNYPVINQETPGRLKLYNDEYFGQPGTLRLEIDSPVEQDMGILGVYDTSIKLVEGHVWYTLNFDKLSEEYTFIVSDQEIQLLHFEITMGDSEV